MPAMQLELWGWGRHTRVHLHLGPGSFCWGQGLIESRHACVQVMRGWARMGAGLCSRKEGVSKVATRAPFLWIWRYAGELSSAVRRAQHTVNCQRFLPWLWPGGELLCLMGEKEGKVFAQSHIHSGC